MLKELASGRNASGSVAGLVWCGPFFKGLSVLGYHVLFGQNLKSGSSCFTSSGAEVPSSSPQATPQSCEVIANPHGGTAPRNREPNRHDVTTLPYAMPCRGGSELGGSAASALLLVVGPDFYANGV